MIFAVPDQVVCGPAGIDPTLLAGCNPTAVPPSTSYRNQFYGNVMGRSPGGTVLPNGTGDVDDRPHRLLVGPVPGNTGNCWHDNIGKDGTAAERHQHAAGAAAALRVRQHEHRHGRPGAGAGAAQLPRGHRVRHVQPVRGSRRRRSRRPAASPQHPHRPRADLLHRAARRLRRLRQLEDEQQREDLPVRAGVGSVRTADCTDWKRGTVDQRRSTVVAAARVRGRSGRVLGGHPERTRAGRRTRLQGPPELLHRTTSRAASSSTSCTSARRPSSAIEAARDRVASGAWQA